MTRPSKNIVPTSVIRRSYARALRSLVCLVVVVGIAGGVSAQSGVGDVVRTVDGSMYRGTIVESVTNDHVTLLLPSGETRRFAAAEVLSSGPVAGPDTPVVPSGAGSDAAGSTPPSAAIATSVRLRVTSPVAGTTLLYRTGLSAGTTAGGTPYVVQIGRVCMAPCDATLPIGNHRFVVEDASGRQLAVHGPILLDRDGEVSVYTEIRRPKRLRRGLIGLGLIVGSVPLIAIGTRMRTCDDIGLNCHGANWGLIGTGLAMMAAGAGVGVSARLVLDRGHVEFRPY